MAIAYSSNAADICQKALYLLREDITVPGSGTWDTETALEWRKCKMALDTAANEVYDAFEWACKANAQTMDLSTWPKYMLNATTYCVARELALPLAGRMGDMKTMDALYRDKLVEAEMVELNKTLDSNADPVLAEIISNFKSDDTGKVKAFSIYTHRASAVKTISDNTVKDALNILSSEALTGIALEASYCLSASKIGQVCGLDANFTQIKLKEYEGLIQEAKRKQLDEIANGSIDVATGLLLDCVNEVKKTLGLGSGVGLDSLGESCVRVLCYGRNGERYGYDTNFTQLKMQEYAAKIQEWRKIKLNDSLSANTDPILAELLANFKSDDTGLLNAYTVYTNRITAVKTNSENTVRDVLSIPASTTLSGAALEASTALSVAKLSAACGLDANIVNLKMQEYDKLIIDCKRTALNADVTSNGSMYTSCVNEVKKTLGIGGGDTFDDLAKSCAVALCFGRNGERYGYDTNFTQLKMQEYAAKIQEWRKIKLNDSLSANTDPILAELLANFKSDDAGILNAYTVYTNRVTAVKATAEKEINAVHLWETQFSASSATVTSHIAYPAFVELCCSKLSLVCGLDANAVALFDKKYQALINDAKVGDLEAARRSYMQSSSSDAEIKEVLSSAIPTFGVSTDIPRSFTDVLSRVTLAKDNARREVLLSHDWNFAKQIEDVQSQSTGSKPYEYEAFLPARALRLISVFGCNGELSDWVLVGKSIKSKRPISKIKYTRDITDLSRWSSFALIAYRKKLAADVARTVLGATQDVQLRDQLYREALENAKLRDTGESHNRGSAWGGNDYVDAMRGSNKTRIGRNTDEIFRR